MFHLARFYRVESARFSSETSGNHQTDFLGTPPVKERHVWIPAAPRESTRLFRARKLAGVTL